MVASRSSLAKFNTELLLAIVAILTLRNSRTVTIASWLRASFLIAIVCFVHTTPARLAWHMASHAGQFLRRSLTSNLGDYFCRVLFRAGWTPAARLLRQESKSGIILCLAAAQARLSPRHGLMCNPCPLRLVVVIDISTTSSSYANRVCKMAQHREPAKG